MSRTPSRQEANLLGLVREYPLGAFAGAIILILALVGLGTVANALAGDDMPVVVWRGEIREVVGSRSAVYPAIRYRYDESEYELVFREGTSLSCYQAARVGAPLPGICGGSSPPNSIADRVRDRLENSP